MEQTHSFGPIPFSTHHKANGDKAAPSRLASLFLPDTQNQPFVNGPRLMTVQDTLNKAFVKNHCVFLNKRFALNDAVPLR